MAQDKTKIIDSLYKVMCTATSTQSDSKIKNNDYFKRRVLGFKAEIEFETLVENYSDVKFLEGGQFISKKLSGNSNDKNEFIYTTISFDDCDMYRRVYSTIAQWTEVKDMLYIKILDTDWSEENLNVRKRSRGKISSTKIFTPAYSFYQFDKMNDSFHLHKIQNFDAILQHFTNSGRLPSIYPLRKVEQFEYFGKYNLSILKKIYSNRYFLDVILRKATGRQIIDLDGFLETRKKIILAEIKEKSPIMSKNGGENSWRYGWDSRRILWYLYLLKNLDFSILYNVRRIDNRNDREFIQWDSIFLDDFLRGTSWSSSRGGGGGEDTLLAPYSFFSRLEMILKSLGLE